MLALSRAEWVWFSFALQQQLEAFVFAQRCEIGANAFVFVKFNAYPWWNDGIHQGDIGDVINFIWI